VQGARRFISASGSLGLVCGVAAVSTVASCSGDSVHRLTTISDVQSMSCVFDDAQKHFTRIGISSAIAIG